MRFARFLLAFVVMVSILSAGSNPIPSAMAADGCKGFDGYQQKVMGIIESVGDDVESLGLEGLDDMTPEAFLAIADAAALVADRLGKIDPPALMADWHEKTIERFELVEQVVRVMAEDGLFAAFIFIEPITAIDTELDAIEREVIAACPQAAIFLLDFDAGVEEDDTVVVPVASMAVARGVAVPAHSDWSVRVDAVYVDPARIDPGATWFVDWLAANPRPGGKEFVAVRLTATNTSDEPLDRLDFPHGFVTPDGTLYDYHDTCGSVPDEWSYQTVVQPGESVSGTLCFVVDVDDIDNLYFFVGDPTGKPTHFAMGA
jgi:hypothetical protein